MVWVRNQNGLKGLVEGTWSRSSGSVRGYRYGESELRSKASLDRVRDRLLVWNRRRGSTVAAWVVDHTRAIKQPSIKISIDRVCWLVRMLLELQLLVLFVGCCSRGCRWSNAVSATAVFGAPGRAAAPGCLRSKTAFTVVAYWGLLVTIVAGSCWKKTAGVGYC